MLKKTPLKKKSKTSLKKLIQELTKLSHDFIRQRDSIKKYIIGGYCFDCGDYTEFQQFQCGHFIPDSTGGALLRYHPINMHGQAGKCNCKYNQEFVKINYTLAMEKKYGKEYVQKLIQLKYKSIKADEIFYSKMIELYKEGNEKKIVAYLESLI